LGEKRLPTRHDTWSKIKELGSLAAAQAWSRNEATKFVESNLGEARQIYNQGPMNSGNLANSMESFGGAMHPVMDNASPTHTGFQVYDGSNMRPGVVSVLLPLMVFAEGIIEHSEGENRQPTEAEMNTIRLRDVASGPH
jgi:hypothetical protein